MTDFHPDFSHRYAALAAGIGRLGWSGNLLTAQFGARVELGGVLTSARLTPDSPLPGEVHPCDGCRMCSRVCPVEMIHPKASMQVTVAGVTETISRKLIVQSGTAALKMDGSHAVADENAVERQTPFGLRVVVPREELVKKRSTTPEWPGQFPLDRAVIEYLCRDANPTDADG